MCRTTRVAPLSPERALSSQRVPRSCISSIWIVRKPAPRRISTFSLSSRASRVCAAVLPVGYRGSTTRARRSIGDLLACSSRARCSAMTSCCRALPRWVARASSRSRRAPDFSRRAAAVGRVKVGLLSDIHANLVALETVLAEMGPVDALWVCGDTVGYGPDPSDVLALLVERKATIVAGNHDRAVAAGEDLDFFNPPAAVAAKMHQAWLTSAERELLAGLPRTLETSGVTLCHGSLRDPLWEYVTNPRSAAASLALARTAHCCAGHTHVPSLFRADTIGQPGGVQYETPYPLAPRAFVNPGSVGQPRDG